MGVIWYYYNYGSTRALHAQEGTRRVSYLVINVSGTDDNSKRLYLCPIRRKRSEMSITEAVAAARVKTPFHQEQPVCEQDLLPG